MKFCKDCKHFLPADGRDLCGHPESAGRADPEFLVHGVGKTNAPYYASAMRTGICGAEAKLFEPSPLQGARQEVRG